MSFSAEMIRLARHFLRPRASCRRKPTGPGRPLVLETLEERAVPDGALAVGPNVNVTSLTGIQAEGTVVINPLNPNNLFVAWVNRSGSLFARYSINAGQTWADSNVSGIPGSCCDPQAAWDSFGNLFLAYLSPAGGSIVVRSINGGATLIDPRTVVTSSDQPSIAVGPGLTPSTGSVWISVQQGSQIVASGALVTGLGTVGSFTTPETIPGSTSGAFGGTAIGPGGEVLVTYQSPAVGSGPSSIYVNLDPNGLNPGGFSIRLLATATNVGGFDAIPAQPARTIDAEANLAWDRSGGPFNGRAYLVYVHEVVNESNDTDIFLRYSDDQGETWSDPLRVNDDPAGPIRSQFNPALAVDQTTGNLAVTWYDARNDNGTIGSGFQNLIPNDEVQVYGAVSFDGGQSFGTNVRISTGVSSGPAACCFDLGDYDTMDFSNGQFYRVWADNSTGPGALAGNPGPDRNTDLAIARVAVGSPIVAFGADAGSERRLRVLNAAAPFAQRFNFLPFGTTFSGGIRVATGDLTGDGITDILAATGPGVPAELRLFDGSSPSLAPAPLASGAPYGAFSGGLFLAAGDLTGDGRADLVIAPDAGSLPDFPGIAPPLLIFDGTTAGLLVIFWAYEPTFTGGVRLALGDVNGDGATDLITSPGPGRPAEIKVYSAGGLTSFLAYDAAYTGGAYVSAGDVNSDGRADLAVGTGGGSVAQVRIFDSSASGPSPTPLAEYEAFAGFTGSVRVLLRDVTGDGVAELIATPGAGFAPRALVFPALTGSLLHDLLIFDAAFTGGVFSG